jgi:asparagine synthase (glutamine-hydrolysing)
MCGISALFATRSALPAESLRALQRAVSHRGPDDEGVVSFHGDDWSPTVYGGTDTPDEVYSAALPYSPARIDERMNEAPLVLTHRRLSILDLTPTGHQPMCDAERRCWVVYNGEVYNYLELREELRGFGHTFSTNSDTEVMLAAYRQWGRECLHRFNGMFAFLLVDRARRTLFAARDRFGVKPLYYWISPDGLVAFASEIKQFSVLPGWRPRLNGQRAYDFLNWGLFDHTDETLFEGVFQLRGGEALELDLGSGSSRRAVAGGRLPVYRWYELKARTFSGTRADAGQEFAGLLTDSVRLRLRADVPVGSCLSGGLDSSSIVCVINDLLRAKDAHALQKTFSACAAVKRFDEREFIEEVVRRTATDAHYVYPRLDELFGMLDRITWHQDEPFGSTSIYAQWHVFRLAAENGVKVMLDGQGADEQLAGYHGFFGARYSGLLRGLRWLTLWHDIRAAQALHGYPASLGLKYALNGVLPEWLRQPLRRLAGRPANSAPWLDLTVLNAEPTDPFRTVAPTGATSVAAMSRAQLTATSLPMLLHWEDRDSMAHSIEARVPFLDYRLVEFVLGLPEDYKIARGVTKRVLREGMQGVLPEKIRTRMDKLGFVTPEEVWLREEGTAHFRKALRESVDASGGILKRDVLSLLEDMVEGKQAFSFLIWRLISFGAWMRVFSVRT